MRTIHSIDEIVGTRQTRIHASPGVIIQRTRSIKFIARCALVVSILYCLLYALVPAYGLSLYSASFALLYFLLMRGVKHDTIRSYGVTLMGAGTAQLAGIALLFAPPESGTHFFLMLVPLLALIAIDRRDRVWWWLYTVLTISLLVGLEAYRGSFEPIFALDAPPSGYGVWRAAAAFLTMVLIITVVQRFHSDLHSARKELNLSYERSENLLLNILPASIAHRLKKQEETIADDVPAASVLFADLVGFTDLASGQSAKHTVQMLNEIVSAFDMEVENLGLEKIKTIGDAYMVAAGVPKPRRKHAAELIKLGLRMFDILSGHNERTGQSLRLRMGINSGPLIAGVIGAKKFSYDIWGDTVNVASRMESTGHPGRIQVTQAVVDATDGVYAFEDRGEIDIKGKGTMKTYFVIAA